MPDTNVQVQIIDEVSASLNAAGVHCWLFGGWGLDAHMGHQTREHSDIEFWTEMADADRIRSVLVKAGFEFLPTQPPEESQEFERGGVRFSCAFFVRTKDGYSHPEGRWSDWRLPPGSFGETVGHINGRGVLVMSVAGMLAMKEQYATLRRGKPLREKDVADIALLRHLLKAESASISN